MSHRNDVTAIKVSRPAGWVMKQMDKHRRSAVDRLQEAEKTHTKMHYQEDRLVQFLRRYD